MVMDQILVKEDKYGGQYVAMEDLSHPDVISNGKDPQVVYEEAISRGCADPILMFIPENNMVQIY